MFKISSGLRDSLLTELAAQFNGTMHLKIYSGAVPATSDAALESAVLLRTVSVSGAGTGMSFEVPPVGGMLVKSTSEVWSGTNVATGTATFYRIAPSTDTGMLSTSAPRLQGSVGLLGTDLILSNVALVSGVTDPAIGVFIVGLPTD